MSEILYIKIIQAIDENGNVVLAKNVNIRVMPGEQFELVYRVIKHGQKPKSVKMEKPNDKDFTRWLNRLDTAEEPETGQEKGKEIGGDREK